MINLVSILAVDDEPFNLDLIEAAFMDYDNVVVTNASDGQEALDLLSSKDFDVVLLDISMPRMDGLEVLQKIRANDKYEKLPVLMVTANHEKEATSISLGVSDFIPKPYQIEVLCARTLNYAVQKKSFDSLVLAKRLESEISHRLGRASEFRDMETGGHIRRMSHYSQLLAQLCGKLTEEECENILQAAPLHDIGKVAIPDEILLKPGRFEEYEYEIMKLHAEFGAMMLEGEGADDLDVLKMGRTIALEHHEKWNGSGYPKGLSGEKISIYARIVAIADVFDALSSKRVYKKAMELDKVLSIMEGDAGTHFDPDLIKVFLDNLDEFLVIKKKYKDDESAYLIEERINAIYESYGVER